MDWRSALRSWRWPLRGPISGGAFNPAVATGITIMHVAKASNCWIYLIGNLGGGALAAIALHHSSTRRQIISSVFRCYHFSKIAVPFRYSARHLYVNDRNGRHQSIAAVYGGEFRSSLCHAGGATRQQGLFRCATAYAQSASGRGNHASSLYHSGQKGPDWANVILSGWLYQTARLTPVTFLRSEIRRTSRTGGTHAIHFE